MKVGSKREDRDDAAIIPSSVLTDAVFNCSVSKHRGIQSDTAVTSNIKLFCRMASTLCKWMLRPWKHFRIAVHFVSVVRRSGEIQPGQVTGNHDDGATTVWVPSSQCNYTLYASIRDATGSNPHLGSGHQVFLAIFPDHHTISSMFLDQKMTVFSKKSFPLHHSVNYNTCCEVQTVS
jgi:hypothetical protein